MSVMRAVVAMLASMVVLGWGGALAQDYPNRPTRIATAETGGGSDFAARVIAQALNTASVNEKFFSSGSDTVGNSPQQFAAFIKSDMATLGKLIRDLGIKQAD